MKSWYAINFFAPLTTKTTLNIDYGKFENSSISNYIASNSLNIYLRNYDGIGALAFIKRLFSKISYNIFNLLVSESQKYQIGESVF